MIHIENYPLTDPEMAEVHQWLNHPGRLIYQRVLSGRAAEEAARAANLQIEGEELTKKEVQDHITAAREFAQASQFFNTVMDKSSKSLYFTRIQPEPPTK